MNEESKSIFNLMLDNIIYIILSLVIVASIASDIRLEDTEKKMFAIKKKDAEVCKNIDFNWIRNECLSHFDNNNVASKGIDFYLYLSFNLFLITFFIAFMKGLKKFLIGNLKYLEGKVEKPFDFFSKISFREEKVPIMKEVKLYLVFSLIVLVGTILLGSFLVLPHLN